MDVLQADDYFSLADEKFDFDITLSPASSKEEDEVFVGPPQQSEAGMCVEAKPTLSSGVSGTEEPSWSPLLGESFESIRKEAHSLASRLEDSRQEGVEGGGDTSLTNGRRSNQGPPDEQFVQDPRDKLGLMSLPPPSTPLSPIKRETFCVRDSPMKLLPPALQPRPPPPNAARPRTRLSTSSPAGPKIRTQTRMSLRGKTGLGVLPNKPPAPSTLSSTQRSGPVDRPGRLAPPGKSAVGLQRRSIRGGSCEDLLSDKASVASDSSDCSLDGSLQGKCARAPPTNSRKGLQTRRHTSSPSLSCLNSSLSVPPTGKPSGSLINPPGATRTRRSMLYGRAAEPTTSAAQRSLSASSGRSTPVKRTEPSTPRTLTPAKRQMEKLTSSRPSLGSSRLSLASSSKPSLGSSSKPSLGSSSSSKPSLASSKPHQQIGSRAKPKALVTPMAATPRHLRRTTSEGVSPDGPRIINPKRLLSTCSVDSLPQGPVELPATPSSSTCTAALQQKQQRSGLPTPSGRRLSFIPTMTPRSLSRIARPACRAPAGGDKEQVEEEQCIASVIPPFSLEEVEPAPSLDGPQGPPSPPLISKGPGEPSPKNQKIKEKEGNQEEEKENQTDLMESAEDHATVQHNKSQDVLECQLVDVPAPGLHLDEKLLIDLSNTPDLVRTNTSNPRGGELIDLSSPLIKWSPEEKGATGVLVNISF